MGNRDMERDKHTDAPEEVTEEIAAAGAIAPEKLVGDLLPPPEFFAESLAKEKISLNVDAIAVAKFRAYAKQHGLKYQSLMNRVLSNYAEKRLGVEEPYIG